MKLIIDIPEELYEEITQDEACGLNELTRAIAHGTPLDDVKAEIFRQSDQNNENFSHDWNEGFNDGMFHTLTIIRECFKHISGKEN